MIKHKDIKSRESNEEKKEKKTEPLFNPLIGIGSESTEAKSESVETRRRDRSSLDITSYSNRYFSIMRKTSSDPSGSIILLNQCIIH